MYPGYIQPLLTLLWDQCLCTGISFVFTSIVSWASLSSDWAYALKHDSNSCFSIEIVNSGADNSVASNWKASATINGTPFQIQTASEQDAVFYPNPFTDKVFVNFLNPDLAYKTFQTEIYNLTGLLVKSVESNSNGTVIEKSMSDVTQGIYVFKISQTNNSGFRPVPIKAVKVNR
jgi:hypothetical protein